MPKGGGRPDLYTKIRTGIQCFLCEQISHNLIGYFDSPAISQQHVKIYMTHTNANNRQHIFSQMHGFTNSLFVSDNYPSIDSETEIIRKMCLKLLV